MHSWRHPVLASVLVLAIVACASPQRSTTEVRATEPPQAVARQSTALPSAPPATTAPTPTTVTSPTATPSPAIVPTATARPPSPTASPKPEVKLEVTSYTSYQVLGGAFTWFVGEATNKGNAPAGDIQIALSLLDDKGGVLASSSTNIAALRLVQPGGKYVFQMLIDKAPKEWKEVKFQIQGQPSSADEPFAPYIDLKVDSVVLQAPKSSYERYGLAGKVTNTGKKTASYAQVIAVLYDKDGKVVDVSSAAIGLTDLAPGGDAPFQIRFQSEMKTAPVKWDLFAQAMPKG